jgi:hypothetical protein
MALRLGLRLAVRGASGDTTTSAIVVYDWSELERVRGERVHVELARAVLQRRRIAHTDADAVLLGIELALPRSQLGRGRAALVWLQRHLTVGTIQGYAQALHLCA